MKQLLVISGKGGTGKTTLVSSLIQLGGFNAFADCDVDAPNLALISKQTGEPIIEPYYGMEKAYIESSACVGCLKCASLCRFNAIKKDGHKCKVIKELCEGCGVCVYVCPNEAVHFVSNQAGDTYVFDESNHYLSSAKLKMGEGNSGLLVTKVKENLKKNDAPIAIIDGAPGIGCPVVASINGVDEVVVVSEPSVSGLSDLKRIVDTCLYRKKKPLLVINKYNLDLESVNQIQDYAKQQDLEIIGMIPFEKETVDNLKQGKTLVESDTEASACVKQIHTLLLERLK